MLGLDLAWRTRESTMPEYGVMTTPFAGDNTEAVHLAEPAAKHAQQIVEIVGHAACEFADHLDSLRPTHLELAPQALRNLADHPHD